MHVFATFRLPDDRLVDAGPGDLIGRLPTAAVRLNDPRVSEVHALVSLRGHGLRLLGLRGRFAIDGVVTADAELTPGLQIQLAPGLSLAVTAVSLQDSVFGIEGPDLPRQTLPSVASLLASTGELVPGFSSDADAMLWTAGRRLHLRLRGELDRPITFGERFKIGARTYTIVAISLSSADTPATDRWVDLDPPLTLTLRYDSVHIHRDAEVMVLDGISARIMTELGLIGASIEWQSLAHLIWPDNGESETTLRGRWDRALARLRQHLKQLGIRQNLVRADRAGRVELVLAPRDRVRDET